jgi:ABC-type transport system substrate-binding protein
MALQSNWFTDKFVNTASGEPDAAKRKQIYAELNDFMLDEAFNITVASTRTLTPLRDRVRGYRRRVNGVATLAMSGCKPDRKARRAANI